MYFSRSGNTSISFEQPKPGDVTADLENGDMAQAQCYHNSRAEAVQSVQKTIGELSQMFLHMASLVTAQEEMIQRIDHDVDETLQNVEQGQDHLLKYFQHMSSNRFLIMKVF